MLWNSDHSQNDGYGQRFGIAREDWKDLGGTVLQPSVSRIKNDKEDAPVQWIARSKPHSEEETKDFLMHYGVPGMKWGVITKEYIKKGYNTLQRKIAAKKATVKAENKSQYNEGYERGQRWAANRDFIRKRVESYAQKEKKPGIINRTVKKYMQQIGLEQYSDVVADKIKDFGKEQFLNFLSSEKGQSAMIKTATVTGKATGFILEKSMKAYDVSKAFMEAHAPEFIKKGSSFMAKQLKNIGSKAYQWLENGGAQKIIQGAKKLDSLLTKYGSLSVKILNEGVRETEGYVRSASREASALAMRGSKALNELLKRRR